MINQGTKGSICFYTKGELIASLPLTSNKNFQYYWRSSENLIKEALMSGDSLQYVIDAFNLTLKAGYLKRMNKNDENDCQMVGLAVLGLIKMNKISHDDPLEGYLVCPRYYPKKRVVSYT